MKARHGHLPVTVLLLLAWRNLWRHRRRTLITLSSIAFGFGLAVLFIGLNDGAHNSMIRNAIKLGEGAITVQPRGYQEAPANHKYLARGLSLQTQVEQLHIAGAVDPRISLQVLASTAHNAVGAGLEGFITDSDQRVEMLRPFLIEGQWLQPGDDRGILIGDSMARKLKAKPGSKVVLMAGKRGGDSQVHLGRVRGIFDSHVDDLDAFLILGDIGLTRRFLAGEGADTRLQPITRLAVYLDDQSQLAYWKTLLRQAVDSEQVQVLDWREMMPQLVQFIAVDDAGNYVFLTLILVLVVFGIINTVLMSVLERTREFGLLRALGLGRYQLLLLVFCESLVLSLLAVLLGWVVGGGTHLWFATNGLDFSAAIGDANAMAGTFMDSVVYTELSTQRVLQLTGIVFGATLATGIYPALKAARVTPVAALRT
ncbi:ABC transporter permease [Exilibacterium tricleocarpae]|nr:FtsX-like permease family protein [Exilibacterium tricleocarpae]